MNINLEFRLLILIAAVIGFAVLGFFGIAVGTEDKELVLSAIIGALVAAGAAAVTARPKGPPDTGEGE